MGFNSINEVEEEITFKHKFLELINYMNNKKEELQKESSVMKPYSQMMLDRADQHGLWDAAIDIARIGDKIDLLKELLKIGEE